MTFNEYTLGAQNMKYNPDIHHRRSIRLKHYDYSQAGAYFVTICAKDRECYFGNIKGGELQLNDAGSMIEKWWRKIPEKFSSSEIDLHIIMPNHFHGIIAIVGADPCVCPDTRVYPKTHVCPDYNDKNKRSAHMDAYEAGAHMDAPLQKIIQWFKTMTTNEYIAGVKQNKWTRFNGNLWQRNYYEHIIRNEYALNKIREYISNNPLNWEIDENYRV